MTSSIKDNRSRGGREGKLVESARQVEGVDSFDLITWLVIK